MSYKMEVLPDAWEDLKRIEDWYLAQLVIGAVIYIYHIADTQTEYTKLFY